MTGEFGTARQEAERLVATVLAMTSQASGPRDEARHDVRDDDSIVATGARLVEGLGTLGNTLAGMAGLTGNRQQRAPEQGQPAQEQQQSAQEQSAQEQQRRPAQERQRHGFATGSPECCVCPICRAMVAVRHPTPQSAARMAAGAGDFASGVASLMRAFSAVAGNPPKKKPASRPAPPPPDPDLAWSAATRAGDPPPPPAADDSPWATATREAAEQQAAAAREAAEQQAAATREAAARRAADAAARKAEAAESDPHPSTETAKPASHQPSARGTDVWAAATNDEDR